VLRDPSFNVATETAINTAIKFQKIYYEGQQQAAQDAARDLDTILPDLEEVGKILDSLKGKLPASLDAAFDSAEHSQGTAFRTATSARSDPAILPAVPNNIAGALTKLDTLNQGLAAIAAFEKEREELEKLHKTLQAELNKLRTDLKAIDAKDAEAKAEKDLAVVRPVLDTFLHELNLIALSPVVLFDVARLWPDPLGTRYGIGGGLRATFLNLNLTVGYSFNPNPQPQLKQGRGAIYVQFEVADLFR
jgi:hypothetical protein